MNEYICVVKKQSGELIKNHHIKAENEAHLVALLKEAHLYLISYRLKEAKKDIIGGDKIRMSTKDIALMCRQLASMLTAGVTLVKALNILYLQIDRKNIKKSIKQLYESVQKGDQFSEGLRKQQGVYPDMMISMIESGEASGNLDHVMTKIADQYEKDVKLKARVQSAMMYPIILLCLAIGVVLILVIKVLPIFMTLITENGGELPLPTQILVAMSDFLTNRWYIVIAVLAAIFVAVRSFLATERGLKEWHRILLSLPVVGNLTEKIIAVRFTRTLATLLSSGMSMMKSLEIATRVVNNRVVMEHLNVAREDIRTGMSLSDALKKVQAMPPMVYSMIAIGEESGTIEQMMEKSAEYYDDEVENGIQKVVSLMEPIMIVFMGVVVGFIIIAMMLPIYELYDAIG